MTNLLKRITALFVCVLILFTAVHFPVLAVGDGEETPSYTVEQVIDLLEQIDSLQEMQDKRKTEFAATKRAITSANFATNDFDEEALAEHQALAAAYEAYIDNMFELRARAKAAYDSLDAAEQAQIPAELSGKLDPYDQLDTYFNQRAYNILVPESENSPYIYQLIGAYECSNHGCGEIPASMALINTTDESIRNENGQWVPDRLYEYGKCNYDIVYCSDAHPSPSTTNLYKRINLEDSTYYSKASARKLRAIVIHSYPYVTIDEMKAFLKANGFDSAKADKLDKSEIIAGVQMAIWYYANIGNADHNDLIDYQYTFNNYKNPWMPNRIHQFQNECWTWWDAAGNGQFSAWRPYKTFLADIGDRITSLVSFLTSLPGQDAAEDQILISDLQITRSKLVPGSDNTYTVGLKVILNHGKSADKDSVTLRAETLRDGDEPVLLATVDLSELSEYEFEVTAQDGDRIRITAEGVQYLEKGVYCYETAAGTRDDQALISVSEGMTRIHAEDTIIFNRESDIGLRISKVTRGEKHNYPISDIKFNVYAVPESAGDIGESPSSTQVNAIAVPENLVGTMTTDNTGYAFMDLEYGIYLLVEQQNDKVIAPADPICFTLPNIRKDGDIVIIADVAEFVVDNTREEFETAAVELKAYKQFDDWGKADSFRFKVAPVTSGAPMPLHDIAVATKSKPTARFEKISFDASCFDTGDPNSNVRVYKYTVTEIDDHVPGVTYDTTPYPVTVTVTRTIRIDAEQNARIIEIDAEIDYGGSDTLIITNTFTPAHAHFEVTKAFEDWGKADSFTFNLAAVTEGAPMPAATTLSVTEADPTAVFAELTFDTVGVYEYIITEVNDGIPGVTYDTTPHAVTVTVTADPDTNALSAVVDYEGSAELIITNTFTPAKAHFEATKEFNDWGKADSFTFVLEAVTDGAPLPKVTELTVAENAPTAVFAELEFDTVGVYEYTITEVNDGVPGVTYDTTPHTVTVTVTAAPDDTNALSAVVKYDGKDALVITNTFTATHAHFEATKAFEDWGKADSFTF
ncbi:MAG: Cys-Gln thioester bond-forming surface protein, partial [Clostridia bacterium]|nr:Cys-Gln thioester bond-forming surface protein [Clostridia bacterium]